MPAIQEPFAGLNYGWNLGESGYNTGMDANMQRIGALLRPPVKSMTTLIGSITSPANGDMYIVPVGSTGVWAGKDNNLAYYLGGAWAFIAAKVGLIARVQDQTTWYGVIENGTWAVVTGAKGDPGVQGPAGPQAGVAYTQTTAAFTQPAVGSTVSVSMGNTGWMYVGQLVVVGAGGQYTVSSITNGTTAVLNNTGASGNAAAAASVPSASEVSALTPVYVDRANVFTQQQAITPYRANISGAVSIDLAGTAKSNNLHLTLTGNVTSFALTNPVDGAVYNIRFIQDGTGSRTFAGFPTAFKFSGGSVPVFSTAANAVDFMSVEYGATEATYMASFLPSMA